MNKQVIYAVHDEAGDVWLYEDCAAAHHKASTLSGRTCVTIETVELSAARFTWENQS